MRTYPLPETIGKAGQHGVYIVGPLFLPLDGHGDARLAERDAGATDRPVCLSNNNRFAVRVRQVRQRGLEVSQGRIRAVEGVEGHAHDVDL